MNTFNYNLEHKLPAIRPHDFTTVGKLQPFLAPDNIPLRRGRDGGNWGVPIPDLIRNKLSTLPHQPGVYLHKDRFGTVIYVGKARDLRKRVSQYFHPSRRLGWDLKFNALVGAIHDFDFHVVRSEPEALLLESRLIKDFKPRYNISFRDDKRFLMLKVNLNDPIPGFVFTRLKKEDGARYFGPFVDSTALRNTVALARKQFNLRGCRVFTPGESDYKHCLYGHLKYCTAPCVGNVTRDQYLAQVRSACDFLEGQCREMQGRLEEEMKKAAAARDYEKAAALRDLIVTSKKPGPKRKSSSGCPIRCRYPWTPTAIWWSWPNSWAWPPRRTPSRALTSPTSAAPSPWRPWSASRTAGPTARITGASKSNRWSGRTILLAWPRSWGGAIPACSAKAGRCRT